MEIFAYGVMHFSKVARKLFCDSLVSQMISIAATAIAGDSGEIKKAIVNELEVTWFYTMTLNSTLSYYHDAETP